MLEAPVVILHPISTSAVMPPKRRRPSAPKARAQAEADILEKGRWSQLRANESLHSDAENIAARARCRQLLEGGAATVDWLELYGQK